MNLMHVKDWFHKEDTRIITALPILTKPECINRMTSYNELQMDTFRALGISVWELQPTYFEKIICPNND